MKIWHKLVLVLPTLVFSVTALAENKYLQITNTSCKVISGECTCTAPKEATFTTAQEFTFPPAICSSSSGNEVSYSITVIASGSSWVMAMPKFSSQSISVSSVNGNLPETYTLDKNKSLPVTFTTTDPTSAFSVLFCERGVNNCGP